MATSSASSWPICFVASALGKEDVDEIYDRGIRPVLQELRMRPLRVDRIEHNDDIDDTILALINRSELCIADLTYARPSVYYEAGVVNGLARPVVYIARSDHFRDKDSDTFHSANGEAVLSKKNGYHGREVEYDEQGNKTVETYIGLDGKPRPIADGYATMKSTYDARGNPVRQTFHGVNGEPVQHKNGYFGWKAEYDENGNKTIKAYLGKDGKPLVVPAH